MLDQQIEACGLPARFYTDPALLSREIETHFVNGWVGVGVTQMIPNNGDVMPVSVAGRPLLMTRNREGKVQVFHNVCRHRGTQLVAEPCHPPNGIMTCIYHTWSYSVDGKLVGAPNCNIDRETKSKLGLLPVRTGIWWDVVFVNLSGTAQPFEEFIKPLVDYLAAFDLSPLRLVGFADIPAQANWKVAAENSVDILHVPHVHPQLGTPPGYAYELHALSDNIFGYIYPALPDGGSLEKYLPGNMFPSGPPGYQSNIDLHYVFPNTSILVVPTFVQVTIREPDGLTTTKQRYHAYLLGEEAVARDGEMLMKSLVEVASQDLETMRRQQVGRIGDATDRGHMAGSVDELTVHVFKRIAEAYDDKNLKGVTEKRFASV